MLIQHAAARVRSPESMHQLAAAAPGVMALVRKDPDKAGVAHIGGPELNLHPRDVRAQSGQGVLCLVLSDQSSMLFSRVDRSWFCSGHDVAADSLVLKSLHTLSVITGDHCEALHMHNAHTTVVPFQTECIPCCRQPRTLKQTDAGCHSQVASWRPYSPWSPLSSACLEVVLTGVLAECLLSQSDQRPTHEELLLGSGIRGTQSGPGVQEGIQDRCEMGVRTCRS